MSAGPSRWAHCRDQAGLGRRTLRICNDHVDDEVLMRELELEEDHADNTESNWKDSANNRQVSECLLLRGPPAVHRCC